VYRTEKGTRQRIIGYIGDVTSRQAKKIAQSADVPCESVQQDFFSPEELPEIATVEPRKTRTERQRQFGGVWLGNKLFETLGVDDYFRGHLEADGKSNSLHDIIKILVISRFYNPSSELYIAEHLSVESENEIFILCKSKDRALKEQAIHDRFVLRIEKGLEKIKRIYDQRKGKDITKLIERRVGRLLQQNSRGGALFTIDTHYDAVEKKTILSVTKNDAASHWLRQTEGHYLLRTNITDLEAKNLWEA
jgi:hypothetical protein